MNDRNVNIVVWRALCASDRDQSTCGNLRKRSTWLMNYYYFCLCAFFFTLRSLLELILFFFYSFVLRWCRPVFSYSVLCAGTSETTKNHIIFFFVFGLIECVCVDGSVIFRMPQKMHGKHKKKKEGRRSEIENRAEPHKMRVHMISMSFELSFVFLRMLDCERFRSETIMFRICDGFFILLIRR